MEFKIDKNVPLPTAGRPRIYPWDQLEVGDSFAFKAETRHQMERIRSAGYHFGKTRGMKFAFRRESECQYRCWRIQ